jgi:hypothetical protein
LYRALFVNKALLDTSTFTFITTLKNEKVKRMKGIEGARRKEASELDQTMRTDAWDPHMQLCMIEY